jgi:hypothetical protein
MDTLVCTVTGNALELVGEHLPRQFIVVETQFVFIDIDAYWAAIRRGAPARRRLERSA